MFEDHIRQADEYTPALCARKHQEMQQFKQSMLYHEPDEYAGMLLLRLMLHTVHAVGPGTCEVLSCGHPTEVIGFSRHALAAHLATTFRIPVAQSVCLYNLSRNSLLTTAGLALKLRT